MFSFFKSPHFRDPVLGEFTRSRGHWRGTIALARSGSVPLVLSGARAEPDPDAIAAATALESTFHAGTRAVETALFEHYVPYGEALAAGEFARPSEPLPTINVPSEVWSHVALVFVSVRPLRGVLTSEFGFTTAWDEEHTLAARFQDGKFVELCGSVLRP